MPTLTIENIRLFCSRNKKHIIALSLFLGTIAFFLFFIRTWFFDGEDYPMVLRSSLINSLKDFLDIFKFGDIKYTWLISKNNIHGVAQSGTSFMNVFYRPIYTILFFLQYTFFKTNAYLYFVSIIALQAANSVLIFYILSSISSLGTATIGSIFFAIHPTLNGWLGKVDTQQHQLLLFFALISLIFFVKSLNKNNSFNYLLSCFFFFLALLTRENLITLPLLFFCLTYLFPEQCNTKQKNLLKQIRSLTGFFIAILLYAGLRYWAYPALPATQTFHAPTAIHSLHELISTTCKFLYNLFWLNCFPWNTYFFFKSHHVLFLYKIIQILLASITVFLFWTNSRKKLIFFLFLLAIHFYWIYATQSGMSCLRLYYETLAIYAVILVIFIQYSRIKSFNKIKNFYIVFFIFLYIFNASHLIRSMHIMMIQPEKTYLQLVELKKHPDQEIKHINLPTELSTWGITQACELFKVKNCNIRIKREEDVRLNTFGLSE